MRNTLLSVAVVIFVLLIIGGLAITSGGGLPTVTQVTNAEGSVTQATDSQLGTLALVVFLIIGGLVSMAGGLALVFWLLNRQVTTAQKSEARPFIFSLSTEGNSIGAMVQENIYMLIFTIGILFMLAFLGLVAFTGAIF
ncbi:MAG: hypothetical protein H6673_12565 [Anaerolineales bacterium]|nr:hypothetical protein [Anaerolineales bacterium]